MYKPRIGLSQYRTL